MNAPRTPPNARSVAARVLERVERDGAFAAAALDAEVDKYPQLDARDRGLATEIVYGVLRTRGFLLSRLARRMPRGVPDDVVVVSHLLVATYQMALLDRVPVHAAVDAAVAGVKASRGQKMAGFTNAVLRKMAADGERPSRESAIVESAPPWLLAALEHAVGTDEARALLGATPESSRLDARVSVRVTSGATLPAWLERAELGGASPVARLVPRSSNLKKREGYAEGTFTLQEEGAQVVALALGARPGERVLDACAGRGQKTALLREAVGADAELFAADCYPEKLAAQAKEFARLGLEPSRTSAVDFSVGAGAIPDGFDRVLVDAPCTGTGTLRRRPEIGPRLSPEDPPRLGALAARILRNAGARAKPGGRVVFAVCSVLEDEAERVVESVSDVLVPVPFDAEALAPLVTADEATLRLTPLRHGTDGFFIASLLRR